MRRIVLLSAIMVLCAVWAMAQYNSDSNSESNTPATEMILVGCLDGAIGNYTLTDAAGATYRLTGSTEQFRAHNDETVQVTAKVTPVVHVPGAMSEGLETQPTLSVTSVKRISGVCGDTNSLP